MKHTYRQIVLFGMLIGLTQCGCMGSIRVYSPQRTEYPVTLFDRYEVDLSAQELRGSGFCVWCDVSFLRAVPEEAPYDTIPILIVDSVCFTGTCLSKPYCFHPLSWEERFDESDIVYDLGNYYGTSPSLNLWKRNEVLIPSSFSIMGLPYLPTSCHTSPITAEISAYLIDRKTYRKIAAEKKVLRLEVRLDPAN